MQLKKHKRIIVILCISAAVLGLILLYLFNESINGIINIILISFGCAYVLKPVRIWIENTLKIGRRMSSFILIIGIAGIITASIIMIIPELINEITNISDTIENITIFFEAVIKKFKFEQFQVGNIIYNEIMEQMDAFILSLSENVLSTLLSISSEIVSLTIIPIIIYYFLADGSKIYNRMLLIIPAGKRNVTKDILNHIDKVLQRYICGQLLLSSFIGILTFISMMIFKVKFPIWISLLNAALNIIPYFGPVFGALPAVGIAFLDSPSKGISIIVAMLIIQQIEGNILSPKITGDSVEMHPLLIIILILIGDKIGGFIGMVIIIPIAVVIKVIYDDINYYLF